MLKRLLWDEGSYLLWLVVCIVLRHQSTIYFTQCTLKSVSVYLVLLGSYLTFYICVCSNTKLKTNCILNNRLWVFKNVLFCITEYKFYLKWCCNDRRNQNLSHHKHSGNICWVDKWLCVRKHMHTHTHTRSVYIMCRTKILKNIYKMPKGYT